MEERLARYRRALHQIPELGKELPKTLGFVRPILEGLDCRVWAPAEGSLCAFFDAGRAETVAFRADMDALPLEEAWESPWRSRHPGRMHACGHDGHTAILLELAHRAAERRKNLPRNVLLIFQCAEETEGGAEPICQSGTLEEYRVKRIFGLHLWPGLEAGSVWSRPGPMMAKNSEVNVTILGKSAHISRFGQGVDALWIGAEFLRRAYAMAAEEASAEQLSLLRFGRMKSGSVRNAVSGRTELEGSIRVFSMEKFDRLAANLRAIGAALEGEYGCTVSFSFSKGYPPVCNDAALLSEISERLGPDAPRLFPEGVLTAEDFSFYQRRVPGVFFFLGVGDVPALHSVDFHFDEAALSRGADFFERLLVLP